MTLAMCVTVSLFAMAIEVNVASAEWPLDDDHPLIVALSNSSTDTWTETAVDTGIYTLTSNMALLATFGSTTNTQALHGGAIGNTASTNDGGHICLLQYHTAYIFLISEQLADGLSAPCALTGG